MRGLAAMVVLWLGCVDANGGPAEIKWDRDACGACSMVISERHFAAEVRSPKGQVHKFDDVGCAAKFLSQQPWAADPLTRVWVARHADGSWLDARAAHYTPGQSSPMGYGFAAVDADQPGASFEQVLQKVQAMQGSRP